MLKKLSQFTLLILLLISLSQASSEFKDIRHSLPLRGHGEYSFFFMKIYEAKLWSHKNEALYESPLALELIYSKNFAGTDIAKQTLKELHHAGVEEELISRWREKVSKIFPDVKAGDSILAVYSPFNGIIFYLNSSRELGRFEDVKFSQVFLDIWLGKKTSDSRLRQKLLGEIE